MKKSKKEPSKASTQSITSKLLSELNKGDDLSPAQLLGSDGMAIKIRGVISTQCVTLDRAIGRDGIPLGRVTLLWGKEGVGKTTVALHLVSECQARGGMAVYIDSEHKLDPDYARKIGVDIANLVILQPPFLEAAFQKIEVLVQVAQDFRKDNIQVPILVVLDSIDATKAKATVNGEWADQNIGAEATVWSRCLPKLVPMLSREDIALLLISQVRDKIGVMYGSKEKTAGGHAPRFYSSLLMSVSRSSTIKGEQDEPIGNMTSVYIGKNQIAPPFRTAEFKIIYGKGIDWSDSLMREALRVGVIQRAGAWYSFGNEKIGQGENAVVERINSSPELKEALIKAIETGEIPESKS